jgi:dCMP deaminase
MVRCPCLTCSVKIVQVGVKEVVYNVSYSMDTQAEDVMRAGGVKVRQFSPPQEGLIT